MSIISPPGFDRPDYSYLPPLFGALYFDQGNINIAANHSVQYGPFNVSVYGYTAGSVVVPNGLVGVELDWYNDQNQDTELGTFIYYGGTGVTSDSFLHVENQGPWVTLTFGAGAGGATSISAGLLGTNAPGVSPFTRYGPPLLWESLTGVTTVTMATNAAYEGLADLAYTCTNGATAEVQWLTSTGWVTIWGNAPGTAGGNWFHTLLALPAGFHQVVLTSTMVSDFTLALTPRP